MKNRIVAVAALSVLIVYFGCAKDYREVINAPEQKFYQGQELEAARMLIPHINKAGRDQLLFMMEAGYLLHMAGKYRDSNKVLLQAANIAKIKPISVSKQIAGLFVNQTKTNYRGEDFEKVLIHMFLGINFLKLKKYDSAAIEFKAVNQELSKIKSENGKARYKQNIMAKYLTAIAHELLADKDSSEEDREYAEVEYRQILKIKPDLAMARRDLAALRQKNRNDGELVVIFQSGRSPIKVSRGKLLKNPAISAAVNTAIAAASLSPGTSPAMVLAPINLAENPIPKFKRRSNKTNHVRVSVMGQQKRTTMLENIEYTAIKNLEDDFGKLYAKLAGQVVIKAIASIGVAVGAEKAAEAAGAGGFSSLIGLVAGAGTSAGLFASMKPDLRCWHTLPANLQLTRMRLLPGKYTVKVDFIGHGGEVQKTKMVNIEIKKKDKHFINIRASE